MRGVWRKRKEVEELKLKPPRLISRLSALALLVEAFLPVFNDRACLLEMSGNVHCVHVLE